MSLHHDSFGELFVGSMVRFVEFTFHTLDPDFVAKALRGDAIETAARKLVAQACAKVQGGRGGEAALTWSDVGAVMDEVARLDLGVRHPDVPIELPAAGEGMSC